MKLLLVGFLSLMSMTAFAECLTVDFIAYEVVCKNGKCIAPTLSPSPIAIKLNSDLEGSYLYSKSLGNLVIESSLSVKKTNLQYLLTIKTEYKNSDGTFGEVLHNITTSDITSFPHKEIAGNGIVVGDRQYYPRVGVFPQPLFNMCQ